MTITDSRKQLSFTILDYEYPICECSTEENYNYDANWLKVQVELKQADVELKHQENCLTTCELMELVEQMDHILNGSSTCFITENMEPYIKFAIAALGERFVVMLQHDICDEGENWMSWSGAEMMDRQRFQAVRDELAELSRRFPER